MTLDSTRRFRQDLRRIAARNYDLRKLVTIVDTLLNGDILDPKYQDHALQGKYSDLRECHISFNWLLVYRVQDDQLVLVRTGTHTDIFKK